MSFEDGDLREQQECWEVGDRKGKKRWVGGAEWPRLKQKYSHLGSALGMDKFLTVHLGVVLGGSRSEGVVVFVNLMMVGLSTL